MFFNSRTNQTILRLEGAIGEVLLDYARKDYRDFEIGNFIFVNNGQVLPHRGIQRLVAVGTVLTHAQCLRRLGFKEGVDGLFRNELSK